MPSPPPNPTRASTKLKFKTVDDVAQFFCDNFDEKNRVYQTYGKMDCRFLQRVFKTIRQADGSCILSTKVKTTIHTDIKTCIEYLTTAGQHRTKSHQKSNKAVVHPIKQLDFHDPELKGTTTVRSVFRQSSDTTGRRAGLDDIETLLHFRHFKKVRASDKDELVSFESANFEALYENGSEDAEFSLCGFRWRLSFSGFYKLRQLENGSTRIITFLCIEGSEGVGRRSTGRNTLGAQSKTDQRSSLFAARSQNSRVSQVSASSSVFSSAAESSLMPQKSRKGRLELLTLRDRNGQTSSQSTEEFLSVSLQHLKEMWDYFEDSERMDRASLHNFVDNMDKAPPLTSSEMFLISQAMKRAAPPRETKKTTWEDWALLPGSFTSSSLKFVRHMTTGGNNMDRWGKAVANVDIGAEELLAEFWDCNSNKSMKEHIKSEGNATRQLVRLEGTRSSLLRCADKNSTSHDLRLVNRWFSWTSLVNHDTTVSYVFAFAPKSDFDKAVEDQKSVADSRPSLMGPDNSALDRIAVARGATDTMAIDRLLRDVENEEERIDADNAILEEIKSRHARSGSWQRRISTLPALPFSPLNSHSPKGKVRSTSFFAFKRRKSSLMRAFSGAKYARAKIAAQNSTIEESDDDSDESENSLDFEDRMSMFDSARDVESKDSKKTSLTKQRTGGLGAFFQGIGEKAEVGSLSSERRRGCFILQKIGVRNTKVTLVANEPEWVFKRIDRMVKQHERNADEVDLETADYRAGVLLRREKAISEFRSRAEIIQASLQKDPEQIKLKHEFNEERSSAKSLWQNQVMHLSSSHEDFNRLRHLLLIYMAKINKQLSYRNEELLNRCIKGSMCKWSRIDTLYAKIQYYQDKRDERYSKAICEVDASPELILAWLLNINSNHLNNLVKADNNVLANYESPVRRIKQAPGTFDEQVVNFIRGSFLLSRLYTCRRVYKKAEDGSLLLGFESVSTNSGYTVDFGYDVKYSRARAGFYMGVYRIENTTSPGNKVTKSRVTLVQCMDAKAPFYFSKALVAKAKIDPTQELERLRSRFDQSKMIDEEDMKKLKDSLQHEHSLSEEDAANFTALEEMLDSKMDGVDHYVGGKVLYAGTRSIIKNHPTLPGLTYGYTLIEAEMIDVVAWLFNTSGRERSHAFREERRNNEVLHYSVNQLDMHSHIFQYLNHFKHLHRGVSFAISVKRTIRKRSEDCFEILEKDCGDSLVDMKLLKFAKVLSNCLLRVTRTAPIGQIPQTKVEYWCKHSSKRSNFPSNFSAKHVSKELTLVEDKFGDFDAVDSFNRAELLRSSLDKEGNPHPYTEDEERRLKMTYELENKFGEMKNTWHPGQRSALSEERLAHDEDDGKTLWGKSTSVVKSGIEEVLAFVWDYTSYAFKHEIKDGYDRKVIDELNSHSMVVYKGLDGSLETLDTMIWKYFDADNIVISFTPSDHSSINSRPRRKSLLNSAAGGLIVGVSRGITAVMGPPSVRVRAHQFKMLKLTRLSSTETKVVCLTKFSLPEGIPHSSALLRETVLESIMISAKLRLYFARRRNLDSILSEDGQAIGHWICDNLQAKEDFWQSNNEKLIESVYVSFRCLRQLSVQYPYIVPLLAEASKTRLKGVAEVDTSLTRLTPFEARCIGASLSSSLRARKTAESGLDQWRLNYPSMVELCERHPFIEQSLLIISKRVLKNAIWGLQWRVGIGAALSLVDITTDAFMVSVYFGSEENWSLAYLNIGMVSVNLTLQAALVIYQHQKKPHVIWRELLAVLLAAKPALDAHRVASGKERDEDGEVLTPLMELTADKIAELVAEAVPAAILQTYAYIEQGSGGRAALFSILVSSCATAYVSTIISFDFDCNPVSRSSFPEYYGYVPDSSSSRSITFGSMFLYFFSTTLCRVTGTALLLVKSPRLMVGFMAFDMILFFMYKAIRRDLTHWVPAEGVVKFIETFFARFFLKVVNDYTGIAHLRHPHEMGGIYWLVTIFSTQVFVWAAFIYVVKVQETATFLDETYFIFYLAFLNFIFVVAFATFFVSIKAEYRHTFSSVISGCAYTRAMFKQKGKKGNDNPERRMQIFTVNKAHWTGIRKKVKTYVRRHWREWREKELPWLTDELVLNIPKDFMAGEDARFLESLSGTKKRKRRSSMGKIVGLEQWNRRQSNFLIPSMKQRSFREKNEQAEKEGGDDDSQWSLEEISTASGQEVRSGVTDGTRRESFKVSPIQDPRSISHSIIEEWEAEEGSLSCEE